MTLTKNILFVLALLGVVAVKGEVRAESLKALRCTLRSEIGESEGMMHVDLVHNVVNVIFRDARNSRRAEQTFNIDTSQAVFRNQGRELGLQAFYHRLGHRQGLVVSLSRPATSQTVHDFTGTAEAGDAFESDTGTESVNPQTGFVDLGKSSTHTVSNCAPVFFQ